MQTIAEATKFTIVEGEPVVGYMITMRFCLMPAWANEDERLTYCVEG